VAKIGRQYRRGLATVTSCGLALAFHAGPLAAQEVASSDAADAASTAPATLLSLRVSPGIGGGSALAVRVGGELDYWLAEQVGVGALVATSALVERFEEARSYVLVGPVLALRSQASGSYGLLSGSLGWMRWSCAPGPCDEGEKPVSGVGGAVKAGYIGRARWFEVGPSLALNITRGHVGSDGPSVTLTLNLELGIALDEGTKPEPAADQPSAPRSEPRRRPTRPGRRH